MVLSKYDANDTSIVVITKNETFYLTQLGENMVTFEKEEAYFEKATGAQGDVVKSKINSDIHKLTFALQPTSPQKSKMISLLGADEEFEICFGENGAYKAM